ncbi:MAG: tryptophan synthase subunit beta [Bacillus subtilis]|nr:tryptophan synthase subunit beta [Bacillus subtilis]
MSNHQFGPYGGQYIPDFMSAAINEVQTAFEQIQTDPSFWKEFHTYLTTYANRPSLLYKAEKLTKLIGGAQIYLKREDLNHTGAHKINNCLGQALLAKRMGKHRIIAETGAGQHGVATATVAALFGMECIIYMGEEDMRRQHLNVTRMEMLGAKVCGVSAGTKTLKDAVDAAFEDFAKNLDTTYYLIGSAVGPHPYPLMVREFQKVIGVEIKQQMAKLELGLPDVVVACVGGGSNAIGAFYAFLDDISVRLVGCEAAGKGIDTPDHAATMTLGKDGVFHGMYTKYIQDDQHQVLPVYSISAGLDYPGVGPEHAFLQSIGRVDYVAITDQAAIDAFLLLARTEGIIPAIESSHAVAQGIIEARSRPQEDVVVINLSGRGDKDTEEISRFIANQKSLN